MRRTLDMYSCPSNGDKFGNDHPDPNHMKEGGFVPAQSSVHISFHN